MSNFYCAAPWRSLHINPRGDVKVCCAGNPNLLLNLNKNNDIKQILDSAKLKEIRQSLRQGIAHDYCQNCSAREDMGSTSERSWHNNINEDFDSRTAGLDYEYPTLLDIRWNTTCNLSCNYCGPNDSSKWSSLKHIAINTNTKKYYTEVCEYIAKHGQHIKEVALIGGEPLLLPENEKLLDVIPNECKITVITNLNNELAHNKVFKKLTQRSNVGWSISFDNIGTRFEYVRHGASWDLQMHNLNLIQDLFSNKGHWGGIHAVYNLYNATRLVEFKEFAMAQGLTIHWQNLNWPPVLNPRNYGIEIATLAAQEIKQVLSRFDVSPDEKSYLNFALEHYESTINPNMEQLKKLKDFIEEIEQYHPDQQGKFRELWPEISSLL